MGKKRSKTAKQRQNVAAKKLAQSFAKKLGVSPESQRNTAVKVLADSSTKPAVHKKKKNTKTATRKQQQQKQKKALTREAADFYREHANAQERGQVMEWKRNTTTSNNNKSSSTRGKNKNTKKSTPLLEFAKPSFALLDSQKTTQQLIQETTNKVAGVVGIGGGQVQNTTMMGLSWSFASNNNNNNDSTRQDAPTTSSKNRFAALQEVDDERTDKPPAAPTTTMFSFAPPSFSLPTAPVDDSIDPDL